LIWHFLQIFLASSADSVHCSQEEASWEHFSRSLLQEMEPGWGLSSMLLSQGAMVPSALWQ